MREGHSSFQEVSEWMSDQKVCDLVPEDFAARLHLIENVLGLEAAEKFFQSIPENKRDDFVYTTILSSYTRSDKTRDKAEFIFWKMRELGYLSKPSAFNHMVSLYIQLDKRDMIDKILNQMEENNVKPNNLTFNLKLRRYAAVTNIETMERLLKEHDPTALDWRTSCEIAKAYLKHGLVVKAIGMLSRAEQSVEPISKKLAYESLMMLYGDAEKADEVYRIWELYKDDVCHNDLRHMNSEGYRSVISSLLKLNDINGADKIVKEWHEGDNEFDVRILSMMASAYCKRGQLRDAEKLTHNVMMRKDRPIQISLLMRVILCHGTNEWLELDEHLFFSLGNTFVVLNL
ncbi:PREDICTED: putative pentatricopeptide repeat-containing protein At1g28020 [Camelina sativa]|uniref:Pentatricopeptide repeat-containing protein At1g28020 n=1 Tax=Camelina sativa TaxID=90675 RepID=A0ABM0VY83_CAMSA|nr:PREDICTED: putative pentatricopeptide repeat-containing protein At1g28020 [Camelina sativa]